MIDENWIYLTLLINGFGTVLYILGTLRGRVRPNRITWAILGIAPLIAGASMMSQGVSIAGAFYTFLTGLGPLAICISTFFAKHPVWEIRRFDIICGILSLVGLGLWLLTGQGIVAIVFAIAADGLAFLPTLIKAWRYPETEGLGEYLPAVLSGLLALAIIPEWTLVESAFPLYILAADLCATIFILRKKSVFQQCFRWP